jgi:hypothetical protein
MADLGSGPRGVLTVSSLQGGFPCTTARYVLEPAARAFWNAEVIAPFLEKSISPEVSRALRGRGMNGQIAGLVYSQKIFIFIYDRVAEVHGRFLPAGPLVGERIAGPHLVAA